MEFQALFHNYIRAPSDEVVVTPLQHLVYFDKTDTSADGQPKQKIESRPAVDVRRGTDSVFENAPQDYEIKWGSSGVGIKTVNLKDVVVWNPQDEGRKMTDMEEGGWYSQNLGNSVVQCTDHIFRKNYICVEPGFVRGFVQLRAGERWIGQQVLSVIESED
jgi:glucose-6-phosphate 1-epimerase